MRIIFLGTVILCGILGWYLTSMRSAPHGASPDAEPRASSVMSTSTAPEQPSMPPPVPMERADTMPIAQSPRDEWKQARATVFWVGEDEHGDNGFIHNRSSAWDEDWEVHFGGYDDPDCRIGFLPCGFTPRENPFYVALPYNDLREDGMHKEDSRLPAGARERWQSDLKDRWIAVRSAGKTCYAQWEDVGPFGEDDVEYVFGDAATPLNTRGERAGIDLSPALRDCLGAGGVTVVEWRHVEIHAVPHGPWNEIITRPVRP